MTEEKPSGVSLEQKVQWLLDYQNAVLPCCYFREFDSLIVSGTITSCSPPVAVKDMHVSVATVYGLDSNPAEDECNSSKRLMMFKVWCDKDDPQLPPDGDTRLWFDFSSPDTSVAVVVVEPRRADWHLP